MMAPARAYEVVGQVTAESIARDLGGKKCGSDTWLVPCPAHDDRTPSLAVREAGGRVLVRCHAGCSQNAVIAALRGLRLWPGSQGSSHLAPSVPLPLDSEDAARRTEGALRIWRSSRGASETLVATYLRSRGLTQEVPDSLRFHIGLKHPAGSTWPAMVGLVTRGADGEPVAIHRTFLAPGGRGKAPTEPGKMMLGPCSGGVVRLGTATRSLLVGEGIETCLSAMQATGTPAWAALSTSGLVTLSLPDEIQDVIVLADGDEPGERAARQAAIRWRREGRRIRIARPPQGMDFNDLLRAGVAPAEGPCR